jgi:hypothetical protein
MSFHGSVLTLGGNDNLSGPGVKTEPNSVRKHDEKTTAGQDLPRYFSAILYA